MSNSGLSAKDEELREVAFGSITTSYAALGDPLAHDAFNIAYINNTDVPIYVSTDGSTAIKKLAAFSGRVIDNKTNDQYRKEDTQFYVKSDGTATEGGFWIEVEYT